MGSTHVKLREPLSILEQALDAGITMFQFREKGSGALKGQAYESFARECQQRCRSYGVPFIVNDDIDLALKLDADGVHVGQEDAALPEVRQKMGSDKIVGVSVHSMHELEEAISYQADYVGIGPIFATKSKDDAKKPAGTVFLRQAAERAPDLPIVAIGGITEHNFQEPLEAGADGVAVISAICESGDVAETVRRFKR